MDGQANNESNDEIVGPPTPRMGPDAKPIYDQEFFLALARCGKDAWNNWRETNPRIKVTFEGVNFDDRDISFGKFKLGNFANFRDCRFGSRTDLSDATWLDSYSHLRAHAPQQTRFSITSSAVARIKDGGERFFENHIDFDILPELTDQDLETLDVSLGDRQRMLKTIRELGAPAPATLRTAAAASLDAHLGAERRQLTVMFCDLVGSMALSTAV